MKGAVAGQGRVEQFVRGCELVLRDELGIYLMAAANELDERDLVAREPPACGLEPDELPFQPLVVDVGEEIRRAVGDRGVRGFRFCLDLRA